MSRFRARDRGFSFFPGDPESWCAIGSFSRGVTPLDLFTVSILNTTTVHSIDGYGDDHRGNPFVVGLCPFTENTAIFEDAKKYIRKMTFWHGAFKITPVGSSAWSLELGEQVICGLCKLDTHHSFACPFNTMPGWWGPKLSPSEGAETPTYGTRARSRGGRGFRGRGNRGRGQRGRRG